jgi:hypothetical protein
VFKTEVRIGCAFSKKLLAGHYTFHYITVVPCRIFIDTKAPKTIPSAWLLTEGLQVESQTPQSGELRHPYNFSEGAPMIAARRVFVRPFHRWIP